MAFRQIFWNHSRLADDSHEIGIAWPAGHDVEMQMLRDASPGTLANVEAHVKSRALIRQTQIYLCEAGQQNQFLKRLGRGLLKRRNMLVRDDHEVSARVGIAIQHHKVESRAMDYQ